MKGLLIVSSLCFLGAMALKPSDITPEMMKWHKPTHFSHSDFKSKNIKVKPLQTFFGVREEISERTRQQTSRKAQFSSRQFDGECGIENVPERQDKVVNGMEAAPHQFPWLGALYCRDGGWFCTGSFISENWFLTAGHCVDGCNIFEMRAGAHDLKADDEGAIAIFSLEKYRHENYSVNPTAAAFDIAVIALPEPLPLEGNDNIRLSCLPTRDLIDETFVGQMTTVTGWGKTSDESLGAASKLHYATDRPIITNEDCALVFGDYVHEDNICIDTEYLSGPEGGIGTCQGDSGGPLNLQPVGDETQYLQIGITSYGSDYGCETKEPSAFARVTYFLDWIEEKTGIIIP